MNNIKIKTTVLALTIIVAIFTTLTVADMPSEKRDTPNDKEASETVQQAAVAVSGTSGLIEVRLCATGHGYQVGYKDYEIFINHKKVYNLPELFVLGESIDIGSGPLGFTVDGEKLPAGEYLVTVVILDELMFSGVITVK